MWWNVTHLFTETCIQCSASTKYWHLHPNSIYNYELLIQSKNRDSIHEELHSMWLQLHYSFLVMPSFASPSLSGLVFILMFLDINILVTVSSSISLFAWLLSLPYFPKDLQNLSEFQTCLSGWFSLSFNQLISLSSQLDNLLPEYHHHSPPWSSRNSPAVRPEPMTLGRAHFTPEGCKKWQV